MSTHKHIDKICCVALAITLLLTILFVNGESFGIQKSSAAMGYADRLFNTSSVHRIDILMDDWEDFISTCENEEYSACTVVIDGESYKNVGIRAKGNTSLTQVGSYGNDRYSFKIEFDCYDSTKSYYGLDKLCLNNIIQDNTYAKDYLTYQMMAEMGVPSPLCSYANISVNGETWGLYLALEGVEESFLMRNYGKDYGSLYKPDSMNMGGGRGNGKDFEMDHWEGFGATEENPTSESLNSEITEQNSSANPENMQPPEQENNTGDLSDNKMPGLDENDGSDENSNISQPDSHAQKFDRQTPGKDGQHGNLMGSDDVLLKYIDDAFESYANIFDNAKTKISDSDKERLIASLKNLSAGESLTDTVAIEEVIRYFVVHNFVLNFDSYTGSMIHNYYLYENGGKLSMIPWDYNLAFGGFQSAGGAESLINYPIDSPISGGNVEDRPMIAWIFANDDYKELYHQYFKELLSKFFDSGKFSEMMDGIKTLISPYVEEDPTKFCTYGEFTTGIDTLKEFCLLRAESIQGQLDGSIGRTSETQSQDNLVSAGDIKISDMGSMGNAMGGRQGLPQDGSPSSEPPEDSDSFELANGNEKQDARAPGQDGNASPDLPDSNNSQQTPAMQPSGDMDGSGHMAPSGDMGSSGHMAPSGMPMPGQSPSISPLSWIFMGISSCVLVLGLLFALFFRRRR